MANIIPASGLDFKGAGGPAEKQVLDFLKNLPNDYYVLRECKFFPSHQKQAYGSLQDRPDFLVVGPAFGILVLEVKDWNILANNYKLTNQVMIEKTTKWGEEKSFLKNPWHQAEEYVHALLEQRKHISIQQMYIRYAVVFPKLTRAEFMNVFSNPQPDNPQGKWLANLQKTLFRDDLIVPSGDLLTSLGRYVYKQTIYPFSKYTSDQVEHVVDWLIPAEMRVGGLPDYRLAEQTLVYLDEEQQKWAISTTCQDKHYLSDVAGSGKTNVLLSRAIYLAKQQYASGGCHILVTTYNTALKHELQRIFNAKIAQDPLQNYYQQSIFIDDITTIMENLAEKVWLDDFQQWREEIQKSVSAQRYVEVELPTICRDILEDQRNLFEIYDYLLIDEVQDFTTAFFKIVIALLKNKRNLFTVGDIGQKIFDRTIEWWDFDINTERVSLPGRFMMYRSPKPVARIAWNFLISDNRVRKDLEDEKYPLSIKPKSVLQSRPSFIPFSDEETLLDHLAVRQNIFDTDEDYQQQLRKDRIKLFIALTRAMREVRLYYIDQQHPFIKNLLAKQADLYGEE